jgi:hypothetical protein
MILYFELHNRQDNVTLFFKMFNKDNMKLKLIFNR